MTRQQRVDFALMAKNVRAAVFFSSMTDSQYESWVDHQEERYLRSRSERYDHDEDC